MRISELSSKFGIPRYHIDYWKKTGLISGEGEYLHLAEVARVRFIWECKQRNISLRNIRRALRAVKSESSPILHGEPLNLNDLQLKWPGFILLRNGEDLLEAGTDQLFLKLQREDTFEATPDRSGKVIEFPGKSREQAMGKDKESRLKALEEAYVNALSGAPTKRLKEILLAIIAEDPGHLGSLIELGNLEFEAGKIERSLEYYEKAMEVDFGCVEAIYNMANIYFKQEKYAAAIRYFERCITLDPEFPESYYNLGIVYFRLNYLERALIFFKRYLELDPDSFWSDQAAQYIEDIEALENEAAQSENQLFDHLEDN